MYIPGLLVSPERNKLSMSEMTAFGPLHEFKLAYKLGLKPSAFGHFGCRKPSPPTATLGLRQIGKRAFIRFERFDFAEQLGSRRGREAVASACRIDELVAFVIANDQRIEILR